MTNRQRIERAITDIEKVASNEAISPTPFEYLYDAARELSSAARFALDAGERDGMRTEPRTDTASFASLRREGLQEIAALGRKP